MHCRSQNVDIVSTFLNGDVSNISIDRIIPNGNGSGGWDNAGFGVLDESPPNTTDFYNKGGGSDEDFSVDFEPITTTAWQTPATIIGLGLITWSTGINSGSGGMTAHPLLVSGAFREESSTSHSALAYDTREQQSDTDPATSVAWTPSGVDAIEGGMNGDGGSAKSHRCSWIMINVLYQYASGIRNQRAAMFF